MAWSPLRLSMDKLVGGSQPAGVAAPTAQDAEQTVVHATPLWSKAAGPLEQVHGEVDWRARPATAPAATRRPRVVDAMAKKLLFQDPVQDLETELPSLMVAVGEEDFEAACDFSQPTAFGGNTPEQPLLFGLASADESGPAANGPGTASLEAAHGSQGLAQLIQMEEIIGTDSVQAHGEQAGPRGGLRLVEELPIVFRRRRAIPNPTHETQREHEDPQAQQLEIFISSVTSTPPPSLLGARPPPTAPAPRGRRRNTIPPDFQPWRSERLRNQGSGARRHCISKAQRVTMKKMGLIDKEEDVDEETLKRFVGLFDHPLSPQHVTALAELLDVDLAQRSPLILQPALGSQPSPMGEGSRNIIASQA